VEGLTPATVESHVGEETDIQRHRKRCTGTAACAGQGADIAPAQVHRWECFVAGSRIMASYFSFSSAFSSAVLSTGWPLPSKIGSKGAGLLLRDEAERPTTCCVELARTDPLCDGVWSCCSQLYLEEGA
jgi:hypothetical protein